MTTSPGVCAVNVIGLSSVPLPLKISSTSFHSPLANTIVSPGLAWATARLNSSILATCCAKTVAWMSKSTSVLMPFISTVLINVIGYFLLLRTLKLRHSHASDSPVEYRKRLEKPRRRSARPHQCAGHMQASLR